MNNKHLIEVLSDISKVLGEVKENAFTLAAWMYKDDTATAEDFDCGTTACAIGWCAMTPWFTKKWGLSISSEERPEIKGSNGIEFGWDAVRELLKLPHDTCALEATMFFPTEHGGVLPWFSGETLETFLFSDESYAEASITPNTVRDRIEAILSLLKQYPPKVLWKSGDEIIYRDGVYSLQTTQEKLCESATQ